MRERKHRSLKEAVEGRIPPEKVRFIPHGFDIIGDIAVIEINEEVKEYENAIADALLDTFKNIRVVAKKRGIVEGDYRTRKIEVLAGEHRTTTVHVEYGCRFLLDVASCYFSPRLGTERARIASGVKEGESVLVMFAGIGPYAVQIAKHTKAGKIYAVEINPTAVNYMRENLKLNKIEDRVTAIEGDIQKVCPEGKFDRIIMPLPKGAKSFLDIAVPMLKKSGTIHFYCFAENPKDAGDIVIDACRKIGCKPDIIGVHECGSYAPGVSRMCIDFKIEEKND